MEPDDTRVLATDGVDVDVAEYVKIEKGRLVAGTEEVERAWYPLDEIALRIEDAGGEVSLTGNLYLEADPFEGPAQFVVVCGHSGGRRERLRMTLSLFDFQRGEFDEIGKATIYGSGDRIARFAASLQSNDPRVGDRLDIRFRLAVHAESYKPGSHYVLSIKAVSLRFQ